MPREQASVASGESSSSRAELPKLILDNVAMRGINAERCYDRHSVHTHEVIQLISASIRDSHSDDWT